MKRIVLSLTCGKSLTVSASFSYQFLRREIWWWDGRIL